ncbi:patatin-like phospholipase RssA [Denitromonas iodatirespirans]|uniref:Patatin-like phospholipase RssA n=1 Tax=Denitromonas iodatirespirans TaxID=2795389 RepID=A0A944DDT9_DENI1|nr:patatin-like phospholipase RssA [Denitromonas iodatirespirans]MBT0963657.1 patatin-like phospholipase RssA [Denitromonas iodatirespirans]
MKNAEEYDSEEHDRGSDGPKIGLALGSGAARGWAHIGVIRALRREGISPDVISGASIGAFVGASAATGGFEALAGWVEKLTWQTVVSYLDVSLRGGLIKGDRLIDYFEREVTGLGFDELKLPFGCVATELQTGREVWLREGSVAQAVRASIATPGLFTPVVQGGRVLVDGALVNPVPVSLCRAMGADIVIAVDLGSDIVGRARRRMTRSVKPVVDPAAERSWAERLLDRFGLNDAQKGDDEFSMLDVLNTSINIMQVRIARSRLAGEPADVLIAPRVGQVGPMDYHRAKEAIAEGEAAVTRMMPAIRYALGQENAEHEK